MINKLEINALAENELEKLGEIISSDPNNVEGIKVSVKSFGNIMSEHSEMLGHNDKLKYMSEFSRIINGGNYNQNDTRV